MSRWPRTRSAPAQDGHVGGVQITTEPEAQTPQLRLRAPRDRAPQPGVRQRRPGPLPLLGAVLVVIALIGYLVVYSASSKRSAVLITTQSLQPGTVLSAGDLRVGELSGDSSLISGLEPGSGLSHVVGQRLTFGLPAGTPLARAELTPAGSTSAQMTLAVSALHALAGALQPGERVTVLATFGAGTGQAHTRTIARGLQVLSVGSVGTGEQPATATVPVTVALSEPSSASALAIASEDGKIDLLLEGSSGTSAAIPEVTDSGHGP
jgi:Flp pilus assembly protein CpaB